MIEYRVGDLLDALDKREVDMAAHGVNCIGGFGSGIAGQIAKRYPIVKQRYLEHHFGPMWKLGHVQLVLLDNAVDGRIVANCATQHNIGLGCADYDAISEAVSRLHAFVTAKNLKLGLPMIGAGLAGGDWTTIANIINSIFKDETIYVYILENEQCPPNSSIPAIGSFASSLQAA